MDMVARFCDAVLRGIDARRAGDAFEAREDFESVVGGVLDMDASCALALSSSSLVTMMQLSAVDETLVVYCAYALMQAADTYEAADPALPSFVASRRRPWLTPMGLTLTSAPAK